MGSIFQPIGDLFHTVFYGPVFNLLMLIYHVFSGIWLAGAFALSIIVLTLLVRAAMIPLTRKQLQSSRQMQVLAPKLKELQGRHRGDPQALMAAQQALYKEHGYSPAAGCLPLLIQMPFLYALFFSFNTVLNPASPHETIAQHIARINNDIYAFIPHLSVSGGLPATQFLWANLAHPDPLYILPFLAGVLTFIQLRMAMPVRKKTAGAPDATAQATQSMQYIMPVMTFIFGMRFPAGLALYWCVGTLFSAVQQYFLNGWGSLFVGIPGMQHLVPTPQESPSLAFSSVARSSVNSTARVVPATASPPNTEPGGIRGIFQQLRDQLSASQSSQELRQADRAQQAANETVTGRRSEAGDPPGQPSATAAEQRTRRPRNEPILIKPQREPLPEERIAQLEGEGSGSLNGSNGASANGADRKPTTSSPAQPRKASGSPKGSAGKGGSSAKRQNTGRRKGGR